MGSESGDVAGFVSGSTLRSSVLELLSKMPVTPTEVAKIENKHVSHICRTIRELEEVGLVEVFASQSRQRYYKATLSGYKLWASLNKSPR